MLDQTTPPTHCLRGCTTNHALSGDMCTVPIGEVPADGLAVTADRYDTDPPVVGVVENGVAREYTPAGARALGHLLIAAADAAGGA